MRPAPSMPDASLVIVNYRGADETSACIDSVLESAGDIVREVVVVDNASGDGSVELLRARHPDATTIARETNDGFAAGVNAGVAATRAPVILLLNPDTVAAPGAVRALVDRLLAEPDLAATGPILTDPDGRERLDAYKAMPTLWSFFAGACLPLGTLLLGTRWHPELHTAADLRRGPPVARLCGSAMAIRRAAWDQVGPMDDGYFLYYEDVDWQARAAEAGWRFALVPQARVSHLIQHGRGRETWPAPFLVSAFRYLTARGHPRALVATVFLLAALVSLATLRVARLRPAWRDKADRMAAGYRELCAVARREGGLSRRSPSPDG